MWAVPVSYTHLVFVSKDPVGNLPNLFVVADGMGGHNAVSYTHLDVYKRQYKNKGAGQSASARTVSEPSGGDCDTGRYKKQ